MTKTNRTIAGRKFVEYPNGVLVPAGLLQDAATKITLASDCIPYLEAYKYADREHVLVLTLGGANQIISTHVITIGLANQSQIHPREVFRPAIADNAVSIILAHNHPSGSLDPSTSDLTTTRRISDAAKIIGINLLDHLIISRGGYVSLRDKYPDYFF